ncbi:unnamed protein product [Amoebophrya sp. A25]|nr:unnamed protein product [Amoebophrya sp. A25]|eukprot:GSA25T00013403001.1
MTPYLTTTRSRIARRMRIVETVLSYVTSSLFLPVLFFNDGATDDESSRWNGPRRTSALISAKKLRHRHGLWTRKRSADETFSRTTTSTSNTGGTNILADEARRKEQHDDRFEVPRRLPSESPSTSETAALLGYAELSASSTAPTPAQGGAIETPASPLPSINAKKTASSTTLKSFVPESQRVKDAKKKKVAASAEDLYHHGDGQTETPEHHDGSAAAANGGFANSPRTPDQGGIATASGHLPPLSATSAATSWAGRAAAKKEMLYYQDTHSRQGNLQEDGRTKAKALFRMEPRQPSTAGGYPVASSDHQQTTTLPTTTHSTAQPGESSSVSLAPSATGKNKEEEDEEEDDLPLAPFEHFVALLAGMLGVIYVSAWTLVFWPQIYTNYKRKNAAALSLGYLLYNVLGFLCYSAYTVATRVIQDAYDLPEAVTVHDALFSLHGLGCCIILLGQVVFYNNHSSLRASYEKRRRAEQYLREERLALSPAKSETGGLVRAQYEEQDLSGSSSAESSSSSAESGDESLRHQPGAHGPPVAIEMINVVGRSSADRSISEAPPPQSRQSSPGSRSPAARGDKMLASMGTPKSNGHGRHVAVAGSTRQLSPHINMGQGSPTSSTSSSSATGGARHHHEKSHSSVSETDSTTTLDEMNASETRKDADASSYNTSPTSLGHVRKPKRDVVINGLMRQDVYLLLVLGFIVFVGLFLSLTKRIPWFDASKTTGVDQSPSSLSATTGLSGSTSGAVATPSHHAFSFLTLLGFVKVVITAVKYPSQILLNHERRSTAGLARTTYLLDLTGGCCSLSQNLLLAFLEGDSEILTGNLPKILIGALCCIYDGIILSQFRWYEKKCCEDHSSTYMGKNGGAESSSSNLKKNISPGGYMQSKPPPLSCFSDVRADEQSARQLTSTPDEYRLALHNSGAALASSSANITIIQDEEHVALVSHMEEHTLAHETNHIMNEH